MMKRYFIGLIFAVAVLSCKKNGDDPSPKPTPLTDQIKASLTTSASGYDGTSANTWINITADEYARLLATVKNSAKYGTPENFMNTSSTSGWSFSYTVGGNDNDSKVPPSSYIIAWSVRTGTEISSSLNSKLKVSGIKSSGYTDYGNDLPDIGSIAVNTRVYFVLKTPTVLTPDAPCYTAVYNASVSFLGNNIGGRSGPEFYHTGDSPDLSSGYPSDSYSQVISTTTRQW